MDLALSLDGGFHGLSIGNYINQIGLPKIKIKGVGVSITNRDS